MKDITPDHLRCSIVASCPAVIDITPEHLACYGALTCPAVLEVTPDHLRCPVGDCPSVNTIEGDRDLLIIGKKPSPELLAEIAGRVGPDEHAIVIPAAYFAELSHPPLVSSGDQPE